MKRGPPRGKYLLPREFDANELRKCSKCESEKALARFRLNRGRPGNVCLDCRNAETRALRVAGRIKIDPEKLKARKARFAPRRAALRARPAERAKRNAYKMRKRRERGSLPRGAKGFDRGSILAKREARAAWRWWIKNAPSDWLDVYWQSHPKPWTDQRLTNAEQYKVRYRCDAAFAQRERERINDKRYTNPHYAMQWERQSDGRWYRATKSGDGSVTKDVLRALRQERWCAYCMCELDASNRTVDHVLAIAAGGTHTADNLVAACAECNSFKRAKPLLRFLAMRCEAIRASA